MLVAAIGLPLLVVAIAVAVAVILGSN